MTDRVEDEAATRIGIVGAGAAGVGAAYALRDADASVTVVEKSGGVCGRAATRRKNGCRYDHGANYLKDADRRTEALIRELGDDGLAEIDEPVWTFDGRGEITPGDGRDSRKWTWTEGITQLAKRLLARTDATVHRRTRVVEIERQVGGAAADETLRNGAADRTGSDGEATSSEERRARGRAWTLLDADGNRHGPFDALLLTPPAPQTAALLRTSEWDDGRIGPLAEAAEAVPYRTIRTVVLHYPFRDSSPWYGLVNTDREHAIGWLSREECKAGHVPDGESLLIVQMSPAWSTERYDDPLSAVADDVADRVAALLGDERYRDPDWIDDQGWRYALPDAAVDRDPIERVEDAGLYVAGDWVVGEGRVSEALWNGHGVGERIAVDLQ
ncbi:NAD(P)/FAD-dependent oxidoreductase [Halobellus rarus]|uniref:NAD(P)/FAD-dependent oxidoreductase n=1 Tax=Halobellus rarus TaxID=1126237 RepID=A0ABD6CLG9_9EURY